MPATPRREYRLALGVAVVHCRRGAAHAPVGPDVLDGLALGDGQVGAAPRRIRSGYRARSFLVL